MRGKPFRRLVHVGLVWGFTVVSAPPLWSENRVILRVYSPQQPAGRSRGVFSASEILDLELQAVVSRRLADDRQVEFKVYTPSGHLYQLLRAELSAPEAGGRSRSPSRERRQLSVSARLPVAGTSIVTNSLYGRWTVVAHLDGSSEPAGPPSSFTLTQ